MRVAQTVCCSILIVFIGFALIPVNKVLGEEYILCSTFPVFLFTRAVSEGRNAYDIKLMLDSNLGCPHDYAPTPAELKRLSRAKVLLINGLGLESFLARSLSVAENELIVVDASGGKQIDDAATAPVFVMDKSEAIENFKRFSQHGHAHQDVNAHLFASPSTAAAMVANIAEGLAAVDPGGKEIYRANAARLADELRAVAARMKNFGTRFGHPKVIVSHSIFDYLAKDLGFTVVAALEEEDGAEPSAARLVALAAKARREGVAAILTDHESKHGLAKTLGDETGIPVIVLDLVASGPADASSGYYLEVMDYNMDILAKQLEEAVFPAKRDFQAAE